MVEFKKHIEDSLGIVKCNIVGLSFLNFGGDIEKPPMIENPKKFYTLHFQPFHGRQQTTAMLIKFAHHFQIQPSDLKNKEAAQKENILMVN